MNYTCPEGTSFVHGACRDQTDQNACAQNKGKVIDGCFPTAGAGEGYNTSGQHNGCVYQPAPGGVDYSVVLADGTSMYCGQFINTGDAVPEGESMSVMQNASAPLPESTSPTSPTPNAGGGDGTGNATTDAMRTASNTRATVSAIDRLRDALRQDGTATREALTTAGSAGGGGLEEGSGATAAATGITAAIGEQKSLMETTLNNIAGLFNIGTAPKMEATGNGTTGGRWKFGITGFTQGGPALNATCSHTWVVKLPNMAAQNWTLDICSKGLYFRAFLFWVFGIWTAWALWSTIYAHARNTQ